MLVHLIRKREVEKTTGILVVGDLEFKTLELPWKDNKPSISCIADGIYKYRVDYSNNKKRNIIELLGVDTCPRSQIQIHYATRLEDLRGCIGVGTMEEEQTVFKAMGDFGIIKVSSI